MMRERTDCQCEPNLSLPKVERRPIKIQYAVKPSVVWGCQPYDTEYFEDLVSFSPKLSSFLITIHRATTLSLGSYILFWKDTVDSLSKDLHL